MIKIVRFKELYNWFLKHFIISTFHYNFQSTYCEEVSDSSFSRRV